ncbi:MAG: hypothetical protein KQI35_04520 [Bacteroidetes bacterium]|nr:hypothetical protein [Bacteroidota bacterium]
MDQTHSSIVRDNLDQEVSAIFKATLGGLMESETHRYLDLAEKLSSLIQAFHSKIKKEDEIATISQFLFESQNTNQNINNLLEETLEEDPDPKLGEHIDQIREEIISLFGIPKEEELAEGRTIKQKKPEDPFWKNLVIDGQNLFNGLLDFINKRKKTGNLEANYILSEIAIKPLQENQEKLNAYYRNLSDLLKNLWEISKVVTHVVDHLAASDYQFEAIHHLDFPEELNSQLESKTGAVKTAERDFLKSLDKSVQHNAELNGQSLDQFTRPTSKIRQQYNNQTILRSIARTIKQYKTDFQNWHNTLFVLSDDWKLELEISSLKYHILKSNFDFTGYLFSRYLEPLNKNIQVASDTIHDLVAFFDQEKAAKEEKFMDELRSKRTEVKRKLMLKMVPEVKKIILESNIPARIDSFEKSTAQKFEQLSKSRIIKKSGDYTQPSQKSELDKIYPQSLVAFQMMPDFMDAFPSLKQGFTRHLQDVQNRFEEIPEIINYSLHTSINFFDEKKELEEAEKIGIDGVKRAENKIQDIQQLLNNFIQKESETLKSEIETLTKNLSEITDNESALQINLRITKARALERSKAIRKKVFDYIKGFLPHILELIQKFMAFLRESSIRIRKQFTLEDQKHFISTDVSDYLAETEKAIDRLPFIYQRLFRIEPLSSFELYTPRQESVDKIKTAYTRWKDGKFAPAVIIAEKGWGKTTTLNRFLKLKLTTEEVVILTPEPGMEIADFFQSILSKTTFEESSEKQDDASAKKMIVIIDGLEKLFEARVNGFDYLLHVLKHISDTNRQIFWLTTCHLYAWEYLDKTIGISDYFGYHIKLSDFTDEDLMKTIERRHNISGYRLMFLPETQKKTLISFKKQTDFGNQEELRIQYFMRMHKIVKGNLSQAFLFWMRSTAQVTEDSVYIEYLSSDYFNFLGSMSDSKLIILKNIVIHNGISAEHHALLFRIPPEKSKLLLGQLYDDGIIIKSGDIYNVNPIIYRQVIDHLYLLNILH